MCRRETKFAETFCSLRFGFGCDARGQAAYSGGGVRTHFLSNMARISHYYLCLGCEKRHDVKNEAVTCCAVVQEIFECGLCGDRFAAEPWAERHVTQFHRINSGAQDDVAKSQTV